MAGQSVAGGGLLSRCMVRGEGEVLSNCESQRVLVSRAFKLSSELKPASRAAPLPPTTHFTPPSITLSTYYPSYHPPPSHTTLSLSLSHAFLRSRLAPPPPSPLRLVAMSTFSARRPPAKGTGRVKAPRKVHQLQPLWAGVQLDATF